MTEAKAPTIQKKNEVANTTKKIMQGTLDRYMPQIEKALPNTISAERFSRMVLTAWTGNESLQKCTMASFFGAMMMAAQSGLEPNTPLGQAYLIPYGNKCQFQIGYMGYLQLAHNAGVNVTAHEVRENDKFEYSYGLEETLVHVPAKKNRGEVIGYYATWRIDKNTCGFTYMTKEECEEHGRRYSKAYKNSPWQTDFDAMAKKTVIKQALKYAPLSADNLRKINNDETIKSIDGMNTTNDMSEVANEMILETEVVEHNEETGEVLNENEVKNN